MSSPSCRHTCDRHSTCALLTGDLFLEDPRVGTEQWAGQHSSERRRTLKKASERKIQDVPLCGRAIPWHALAGAGRGQGGFRELSRAWGRLLRSDAPCWWRAAACRTAIARSSSHWTIRCGGGRPPLGSSYWMAA